MHKSAALIVDPDLEETLSDIASNAELFRMLADRAPVMLWVVDTEGYATFLNKRWLSFTGKTASEVTGHGWVECLHQDDRDRCWAIFTKAVERRAPLEMEYRLRREDNQYRNMMVKGEPLHDVNGAFTGLVGCVFDITKQAEDESALRTTNLMLKKRTREISLLNELNDNLQVCQSIDETKPILKRYGKQLFPDYSVSLSLFNESRNLIEPFVDWGEEVGIEGVFTPDDCWALRKSKPHMELADGSESICPNFANCAHTRYICVPMMAYGEVIGNMHFVLKQDLCSEQSNEARQHIDEMRQLALMASDQIALALANLKLRATLQYQSTRDPMTQLYNRRYLSEALERELSRSERAKTPLALLVIDIDNFKRYNDTYGHEAGDLLLREFGALLRQMVRGSDIACRYGGEEFVLVMPEASAIEASEKADQIRRRLANLKVEYQGQAFGQVTISIGVSQYPVDGVLASELLNAGDSALYQAKANGRNCVVRAGE